MILKINIRNGSNNVRWWTKTLGKYWDQTKRVNYASKVLRYLKDIGIIQRYKHIHFKWQNGQTIQFKYP